MLAWRKPIYSQEKCLQESTASIKLQAWKIFSLKVVWLEKKH